MLHLLPTSCNAYKSTAFVKPIHNRWAWGRCLVKLSELQVIQEGNHDDPKVATTRHCHTECDLSGEYHRYLPKDIQMEGRAGHKNHKMAKLESYCTQCKGNMGGMIDISKSTVKLLEQC